MKEDGSSSHTSSYATFNCLQTLLKSFLPMSVKSEVEALKQKSIYKRASQKPKSDAVLVYGIFVLFFVFAILYAYCTPKMEVVGYDEHWRTIYEYPQGSIYKFISPKTGFFLLIGIGICSSYFLYKRYGKRWDEYNEIIKSANLAIKYETERQQESLFKSRYDKLINKYGNPDTKLCLGNTYDITSYIIPFSSTRKIYIQGFELNFDDIIDVQLTDDVKVTKGEMSAVTESSTGSAIGRAVVGGVLAGGAGAIIGGTTGKKNTTFIQENDIVTHDYTVLITTKIIAKSLIKVHLNERNELANMTVALIKSIIANG